MSRVVTAPFPGYLTVKTDRFSGDWDLLLRTADGKYLAGSYGDQVVAGDRQFEAATAPVTVNQRVTISVCNWTSPDPTIRVSWAFTRYDTAGGKSGPTKHLRSGGLPQLRERIPINIVLIGYGDLGVNTKQLTSGLPKAGRPAVRMPRYYGSYEPLGLRYDYDYRVVRATKKYEDAFFGQLLRLGDPAGLTAFQKQYNAQTKNVVSLDDDALRIPATPVQRWLEAHPAPGTSADGYTVALVNWWGRNDFRPHVYESRQKLVGTNLTSKYIADYMPLVAWGGVPPGADEKANSRSGRVWFHDLSAGPDYWTGSWKVDSPDLDGDGQVEYRMPPAWEYRTGGYRARGALTADLTKVVRYVAIDMLFTPSPLYSPSLTPPKLPRSLRMDNHFIQLGTTNGQQASLSTALLAKALAPIVPTREVTVTSRTQTLPPRSAACLAHYLARDQVAAADPVGYTWLASSGCDPAHAYGWWSNPFVGAVNDRAAMSPDPAGAGYRLDAFIYALPDNVSGCYAYADDNQRTGTQSFVHFFLPDRCYAGVGTQQIMTHEPGHHFGLSHPHDGQDIETGKEIYVWGDSYYAGLGDMSATVMSYMWVTGEFSQFDRDNSARWATASYLQQAQAIIALAKGKLTASRLAAADRAAARAAAALGRHDYLVAATSAADAYFAVLAAAAAAGVTVTGSQAGTSFSADGPDRGVLPAPGAHVDGFEVVDGAAFSCLPTPPGVPLLGNCRLRADPLQPAVR